MANWTVVQHRNRYRPQLIYQFLEQNPGLFIDVPQEYAQSPIFFFDTFSVRPPQVDLYDYLVCETNRYANDHLNAMNIQPSEYSYIANWHDTNRREMRAFIGLVLLMGIIRKPAIKDYWERDGMTDTPIFIETMSRNRFMAIWHFFHAIDNSAMPGYGEPGYNTVQRIATVKNMLNHAFCWCYNPDQQLSIDESMVPYKGNDSSKQYNRQKHTRWGTKLWALAESTTGYTLFIDIYPGKRWAEEITQAEAVHGRPYTVTMQLLERAGCLNKGHHVVVDNYYCSPALAEDLYSQGTYLTGTIRKKTDGLSQNLIHRRLDKGDYCMEKKRIMDGIGTMLAVKWHDRAVVKFLSTFSNASVVDRINRRGRAQRMPSVANDYNRWMGGVDLADQLIRTYSPHIRGRKLWRTLFLNFLKRMTVNAYVLYKTHNAARRKMCRKRFLKGIVSALIDGYREGNRIGRPLAAPRVDERLTGRHFPRPIPDNKRWKCHVCADYYLARGQCIGSRIGTWCADCQVALCDRERDCFIRWHTLENPKL